MSIDLTSATAVAIDNNPVTALYLDDKLIWSGAPVEINNLLPTATDTDRVTIYNGIGYYNGKRWSSSGGKITTGNNTTSMTGFFDCKPGDVLRVWNYTQISGTQWYIITFDTNQKVVKCVGANGASPSGGYEAPGYSETVLTEAEYGNFTSIRLSWGQFNADSIVTINQKIPH